MTRMNEGGAEQERRKPKPILTDTLARSIKPDGPVLPDRTVKGLKLKPTSRKGRGYWFLYYNPPVDKKKRSELSLGTYPDVSIAEAREKATEARKLRTHPFWTAGTDHFFEVRSHRSIAAHTPLRLVFRCW